MNSEQDPQPFRLPEGENAHSNKRARTVVVFVNPAGQRDNIGDSVLRRAYLNALRKRGTLHVLVGKDRDFGSGLGLQEEDILYSSRAFWLLAVLVKSFQTRPILALNSGEFVGRSEDKRRSTWQLLLAEAVSRLGGRVVLAGASIRPGTSVSNTYLKQLASRSCILTWRDEATAAAVGAGGIQPDWAFHLGTLSPGGKRPYLAVSMRGDRPEPSDEWVTSLNRFAEQCGYEIRVVVQVRRDAEAAVLLGRRLGSKVLLWPDERSHAEHERTLREFYRTCSLMVSDRIHALIIAATEGAVPVGAVVVDSEKLTRTFEHVTPLGLVQATDHEVAEDRWRQAVLDSGSFVENIYRARAVLDAVEQEISVC